jgi:carbonic anhydrase
LNVKQQVVNVSRNSSVQKAWLRGQNLQIHGVLYNLNNGILQDLGITINKIDHVP